MLGFISNMQFACRKKRECRDEVIRRCHLYLTSFGYLVHRLPGRDGNAAGLKENLAGFVWSSRDHFGNWITRSRSMRWDGASQGVAPSMLLSNRERRITRICSQRYCDSRIRVPSHSFSCIAPHKDDTPIVPVVCVPVVLTLFTF